jgi:hypothetical protein
MTRLSIFAAALVLVSCSDAPGVGGSCVIDDECPAGASCVGIDASELRLCLRPCDPTSTVLCDPVTAGSAGVCIVLGEGGACFTGGGTAVGDACERSTDCELGALCVVQAEEARCQVACDLGAPVCGAGSACQALDGAVRGFCAPVP